MVFRSVESSLGTGSVQQKCAQQLGVRVGKKSRRYNRSVLVDLWWSAGACQMLFLFSGRPASGALRSISKEEEAWTGLDYFFTLRIWSILSDVARLCKRVFLEWILRTPNKNLSVLLLPASPKVTGDEATVQWAKGPMARQRGLEYMGFGYVSQPLIPGNGGELQDRSPAREQVRGWSSSSQTNFELPKGQKGLTCDMRVKNVSYLAFDFFCIETSHWFFTDERISRHPCCGWMRNFIICKRSTRRKLLRPAATRSCASFFSTERRGTESWDLGFMYLRFLFFSGQVEAGSGEGRRLPGLAVEIQLALLKIHEGQPRPSSVKRNARQLGTSHGRHFFSCILQHPLNPLTLEGAASQLRWTHLQHPETLARASWGMGPCDKAPGAAKTAAEVPTIHAGPRVSKQGSFCVELIVHSLRIQDILEDLEVKPDCFWHFLVNTTKYVSLHICQLTVLGGSRTDGFQEY